MPALRPMSPLELSATTSPDPIWPRTNTAYMITAHITGLDQRIHVVVSFVDDIISLPTKSDYIEYTKETYEKKTPHLEATSSKDSKQRSLDLEPVPSFQNLKRQVLK